MFEITDEMREESRGRQHAAALKFHRQNHANGNGHLKNRVPKPAEAVETKLPEPLDMARIVRTKPTFRRFHFERVIAAGCLIGIVAMGGMGKGWVTLTLAISAVIGRALFPSFTPARRMRVLIVASEDDAIEFHIRIHAIAQHFALTEAELDMLVDGPRIYSGKAFPLVAVNAVGHVTPTNEHARLADEIKAGSFDLALIDPLAHFIALEENSNVEMAAAMNHLSALRPENSDTSILIVHHVAKAMENDATSAASRGASAFRDTLRACFNLAPLTPAEVDEFGIAEPNLFLRMVHSKANWTARIPGAVYFQRHDGGVLAEVDMAARRDTIAEKMVLAVAKSLANEITDNPDNLSERDIRQGPKGVEIRDALKQKHGNFASQRRLPDIFKVSFERGWIRSEPVGTKTVPRATVAVLQGVADVVQHND